MPTSPTATEIERFIFERMTTTLGAENVGRVSVCEDALSYANDAYRIEHRYWHRNGQQMAYSYALDRRVLTDARSVGDVLTAVADRLACCLSRYSTAYLPRSFVKPPARSLALRDRLRRSQALTESERPARA